MYYKSKQHGFDTEQKILKGNKHKNLHKNAESTKIYCMLGSRQNDEERKFLQKTDTKDNFSLAWLGKEKGKETQKSVG